MRNVIRLARLRLLSTAFAVIGFTSHAEAGAGITYHGRLLKSDNTPVSSSVVQFHIQIRTPGNENCLLYQETHTRDMSAGDGIFAITLGDGTASTVNTEPFTLDRAFQNRGTFSFGGGKCTLGGTYAPNPTDGRKLFVEFNDGSFAGFEALPAQAVNFVPLALEAVTLNGYGSGSMLRVNDGAGAPASISALTQTQYDSFLDLLSGSSPLYLTSSSSLNGANLANGSVTDAKLASGIAGSKISGNISGDAAGFTGSLAGDVTGSQSATSVTKLRGRDIDSNPPSNGQVLKWNAGASRWEASADAGLAAETDPTVPANLKDGVDWTEVDGKPATFAPSAHGHFADDILSGAGHYLTYKPNNVACANGQVLKWNDSAGRWECGTDASGASGTVTTVTGTGSVQITGTATDPIVGVQDATSGAKGVVQLATDGQNAAGVVVQGNDSRLANSRAPNGSAGGDLSASYPNPTVAKIQGVAVSAAAPAVANVLKYDGSAWAPAPIRLSDLKSSVSGDLFNAPNCTSSQTLSWSSLSDQFTCQAISYSETDPSVAAFAKNAPSADFTTPANVLTLSTVTAAKGGTGLTAAGTANQILGANAAGTAYEHKSLVQGSGVTITHGAGTITISASGGGSGPTDLAADVTGVLPMANGGTGLTAFGNHAILATNGSGAMAPVTGSVNGSILQYSLSGPAYSAAAFPSTTTANQLLYSSANNVVGGLPTANNAILTTDGSGAPSWTTTSGDFAAQYAFLAGRAAGQTLSGGNATGTNLTLDSNSTGTKGYVLLNPAGGNVGVGTTAPAVTLHLSADGAAKQKIDSFGIGAASSLEFHHSGGTPAAPSATAQNETLFQIFGTGYGTTAPLTSSAAKITAVAEENFSDTTGAGSLRFHTRPPGSVSASAERMRIDPLGNVGIGTTAPNPAARLEISSSNQGFLPPRMTSAQRNAIASPPEGLIIYNTSTQLLDIYTAAGWRAVSGTSASVGNDMLCWGANSYNNIGDNGAAGNTQIFSPYPASVIDSALGNAVSAGGIHTCALRYDGAISCFGENSQGALGNNTTTTSYLPVLVQAGGLVFQDIAASHLSTCALTTTQQMWCWGYNNYGQLGVGDTTRRLVPTQVSTALVSQWSKMSRGSGNDRPQMCGLNAADGKAYCWGRNNNGQLGDASTTTRTAPVAVNSALSFVDIDAEYEHACALTGAGQAYCWGSDSDGQLGNGPTTGNQTSPVAVDQSMSGGITFAKIRVGMTTTCALTLGGQAYCWGRNNAGQLGDGTTTAKTVPTAVTGGHVFQDLDVGYYSACGRKADGSMWCWGYNGYGQVGDSTGTNRTAPTKTYGSATFKGAFSVGPYYTTNQSTICGLR